MSYLNKESEQKQASDAEQQTVAAKKHKGPFNRVLGLIAISVLVVVFLGGIVYWKRNVFFGSSLSAESEKPTERANSKHTAEGGAGSEDGLGKEPSRKAALPHSLSEAPPSSGFARIQDSVKSAYEAGRAKVMARPRTAIAVAVIVVLLVTGAIVGGVLGSQYLNRPPVVMEQPIVPVEPPPRKELQVTTPVEQESLMSAGAVALGLLVFALIVGGAAYLLAHCR